MMYHSLLDPTLILWQFQMFLSHRLKPAKQGAIQWITSRQDLVLPIALPWHASFHPPLLVPLPLLRPSLPPLPSVSRSSHTRYLHRSYPSTLLPNVPIYPASTYVTSRHVSTTPTASNAVGELSGKVCVFFRLTR